MSTRKSSKSLSRCSGASLIELMLSQALSLIVIVAALGLLAPTVTGFTTQSAISNIQESGRIALDEIAHHIRQAGYGGCNPGAARAVVLDPNHPEVSPSIRNWAFEYYRVKGIDAMDLQSSRALLGSNWHQRRLRSGNNYIGDLIMVRSTEGRELKVIRHDTDAQSIQFDGDATDLLNRGQIIELNDCMQATTFQIDRFSSPEYNAISDSTLIQYNEEVTVNCSGTETSPTSTSLNPNRVLLGGTHMSACSTPLSRDIFTSYEYLPGSNAHKVVNAVYYVGRRDDSGDSYLYRTGTADDGARVYTEAIVEGIENLRALYGVDLDQDGIPDEYWNAARFENSSEKWSEVISVRVWLMINSTTSHSDSASAIPVAFPDHTGQLVDCDGQNHAHPYTCPDLTGPADNKKFYKRKVIETEIYLNNPKLS